MTRAKFRCKSITKTVRWNQPGFAYEATFEPVTGGSPENEAFFEATPWGEIKLGTIREDHFVPGAFYYVDFTPVDGAG